MGEDERRAREWNMGEREEEREEREDEEEEVTSRSSTPDILEEVGEPSSRIRMRPGGANTIIDLVDDDEDEEEDNDYEPPVAKPKLAPKKSGGSVGKKSKSRKSVVSGTAAAKFEAEFAAQMDAAEFYVSVRVKPIEGEWYGVVANIEIPLKEEVKLLEDQDPEQELWMFVSRVGGFVYCQSCTRREGETDGMLAARRRRAVDFDGYNSAQIGDFGDLGSLRAFADTPAIVRGRRPVYLSLASLRPDAMTLAVTVSESTLDKVPSASAVLRPVPALVRTAMDTFLRLEPVDHYAADAAAPDSDVKPDVEALYEVIKRHHGDKLASLPDIDPQHRSLLPRLRPYQKLAVRWMIEREKQTLIQDSDESGVHVLYKEVKTLEGASLYYNQAGGYLVKERPAAKSRPPPGGILADEMGLGKTVEVLSLMLCHQREDVPEPEHMEPVVLKKASAITKRKRRRRRTPSPVEFELKDDEDEIEEPENSNEDDHEEPEEGLVKEECPLESFMQVDGENDTDDSDESDDDDYVPPEHSSRGRSRSRPRVSYEQDNGGGDSDIDEPEYVPRPSTSRRRLLLPDGHETAVASVVNSAVDRVMNEMNKRAKKSPKKKSVAAKKKVKTEAEPSGLVDGAALLKSKEVKSTSCISDLIVDAIVSLRTKSSPSVPYGRIRKHLVEVRGKTKPSQQAKILATVKEMEALGQLANTGKVSGGGGHYMLNPGHAEFDTRGGFLAQTDPQRVTIEEVS